MPAATPVPFGGRRPLCPINAPSMAIESLSPHNTSVKRCNTKWLRTTTFNTRVQYTCMCNTRVNTCVSNVNVVFRVARSLGDPRYRCFPVAQGDKAASDRRGDASISSCPLVIGVNRRRKQMTRSGLNPTVGMHVIRVPSPVIISEIVECISWGAP